MSSTRFRSLAQLVLIGLVFHSSSLIAALHLPQIFSSHMVLQQGKPIVLWGKADPGGVVEVHFAGEKLQVEAGEDGQWRAELPAQAANAEGQVLTVKSGGIEERFEDVLVGEVWIASGQSNMQWAVGASNHAQEEIKNATFSKIRLFQATMKTSEEPVEDIANTWGGWERCAPERVARFSAVGYYFGREIHQQGEEVPVGIIQSAWGGTRSEAWTSREALLGDQTAAKLLADWRAAELGWNAEAEAARYAERLAAWEKKTAEMRKQTAGVEGPAAKKSRRLPRRPEEPIHPRLQRHHPSAIYNAMISPLVPFPIRGVIWYQGESNQDRAHQYASIFPTMIEDWRAQWDENFPFLFVQLANFRAAAEAPVEEGSWPELQWSQYLTLKRLLGTGMAVANDIGAAADIHPRNKQDVGKRLARWALSMAPFAQEIVPSGPVYKGMKKEQAGIRIFFDHVGEGLRARGDEPLGGFAIAGEDRSWHAADAQVEGNSVFVSHQAVDEPLAVRYAWKANPTEANLVNSAGLPASLFRTDGWPLTTEGVTSPFAEKQRRKAPSASRQRKADKTPDQPKSPVETPVQGEEQNPADKAG